MQQQQKSHRNKKSSSCRQRRRNSLAGGPLEPIYEHEHDGDLVYSKSEHKTYSPLREYMSGTFMNHVRSHPEFGSDDDSDEFHIVADNASSSHPEFIVQTTGKTKMTDNRWEDSNQKSQTQQPRKSSKPSPAFPAEGRWGSGDSSPTTIKKRSLNFMNDSNSSSIHTESTSSLTLSLWDIDDDDDLSVESFDNSTMTTREIIDRASYVVTGNNDYNNTNRSFQSNIKRTGDRRQARRSSLPCMPMRQESVSKIDCSQPSSKPIRSANVPMPQSTLFESNSVALDKFGIPIPTETRTSNIGMGRRRRGRRSSMGDVPTSRSSSGTVDKFGVPIPQSSSRSCRNEGIPQTSSHSTRCCRSEGIPQTSSHSTSTSRSEGSRRRGRRSSMPTNSSSYHATTNSGSYHAAPTVTVESSYCPGLLDKYGVPIRPLDSSSSTHSRSTGRRQYGRRSSMPTRAVSFDLPPAQEISSIECHEDTTTGSLPVDKFGVPIWPKEMSSCSNCNNNMGRLGRQARRSSLPNAFSSTPFDKHDVPVTNRSVRRGRRPSMPTVSTSTCNYTNAMRLFPEELQIPGVKTNKNVSKPVSAPANGAPICPERVPSIDSFGSKNGNEVPDAAKPNASWTDTNSNASNTLDEVLGGRPKSRWGKDREQTTGNCSSSDVSVTSSVNSMKQKDGEWWW